MALNKAFLGHSIFTQLSIRGALTRFQNYGAAPGALPPNDTQRIDRFIQALKDMQIATVFIQLFSREGDVETNVTDRAARTNLITALGQAGINWAGWGYCAGNNCATNKNLIVSLKTGLGMLAFMIDAEPGNTVIPNPANPSKPLPDLWAQTDFDDFTSYLQQQFGTDNLALTTWPILQIQDGSTNPVVALMRIAAPRVGAFVPQAYWMNFPTNIHYRTLDLSPNVYPPNDPDSYVRMVIKSWSMLNFTNPLVIAGQAYWGEGGPDQPTMEAKVASFTSKFTGWQQIFGFGWYHAGQTDSPPDAMSDAMIATIKQAKLGAKPYQQPAVAGAPAAAQV